MLSIMSKKELESLKDADLVNASKKEDGDAIAVLVNRYKQVVFGTVWSLLQDYDDTEDATQEAFVLAYRHLNDLKSPEKFSSWIYSVPTPDRIEALIPGMHFFNLATYSLSRIVFVELSMFLSDKEERSLLDWLKKAKEHAASVEPTRYNAANSERERIECEEYCNIIDNQICQLHARKCVINRIKAHRDKAIAHLDKRYFDDPKTLNRDYPLDDGDIGDLHGSSE